MYDLCLRESFIFISSHGCCQITFSCTSHDIEFQSSKISEQWNISFHIWSENRAGKVQSAGRPHQKKEALEPFLRKFLTSCAFVKAAIPWPEREGFIGLVRHHNPKAVWRALCLGSFHHDIHHHIHHSERGPISAVSSWIVARLSRGRVGSRTFPAVFKKYPMLDDFTFTIWALCWDDSCAQSPSRRPRGWMIFVFVLSGIRF